MKPNVICFFFLLLCAVFSAFTFAQGHPEKAPAKARAFASACIVEPLGISKSADLVWEWKGNAPADAHFSQNLEVKEASFELRARPVAVFYLSLPTSTIAYSGKEKIEITAFSLTSNANAVMGKDGSYSIQVQAVPHIMRNQKEGCYSGRFEVCLAYN